MNATNTSCSPCSPHAQCSSCCAAPGPTGACPILVESGFTPVGSGGESLMTSICGGPRGGLFPRAPASGSISECRANLSAAPSCDTVLYKPSRAGICQANEHCNWFQLPQILLFFLLYWWSIPCNALFVVHLPWRQQLTVKYLSGTSSQTEPFLLQT